MARNYRKQVFGTALMLLLLGACTSPGSQGGEPEPEPPPAPTAVITLDPASGTAIAPATITFDASASTGDITSYRWFLNDESLSTEPTLEHAFATAGTFDLRLVVTDDRDRSDSAEAAYVVLAPDDDDEDPDDPGDPGDDGDDGNDGDDGDDGDDEDPDDPDDPGDDGDDGDNGDDGDDGDDDPTDPTDPTDPAPPVASISITPASGTATAPATVTLDASGSSGEITSYEWFVDGTAIASAASTSHEFATSGTHTVTLVVTDELDRRDTVETDYLVLPAEHTGQSHTLTPADFGSYAVNIQPAGAWTATTSAAWLNVSPTSGSGDATAVTLTVDPSALPSGNAVSADLTITDTTGVRIDEVTALLPQLAGLTPISRTGLLTNSTTDISFGLTNSGSTSLSVALELQGSGPVQAVIDSSGTNIQPGTTHTFQLSITCPAAPASYTGTLIATTNDPRNPGTSVAVSISCVEPSSAGDFAITLVFQPGAFTPQQQAMVRAAADRWEEVITGDIPDASDLPQEMQDYCLWSISWQDEMPPELQAVSQADDLIVSVFTYEDAANILARAGPCVWGDRLPNHGRIMINTLNLEFMTTTTSLESVMIHELGHILGVGTIWRDDHRDLARPSQAHCLDANHEPHVTRTFAGPRGVNEHHALGAAGQPPLDQNCAHWSEQRFQTEVLTPSITISSDGNNHQPLSRMTIGALEDIGYVVDYTAADAYALPSPGFQQQEHEGQTFTHGDPIGVFPDLEDND